MRTGTVLMAMLLALALAPASASAALDGGTRINTGGAAYTALDGTVWSADGSFTGGDVFTTTRAISGTTDARLYQDERYGQFTYSVPVANGTYDVRLHFVEIYYGSVVSGGAGKRVFGMDVLDTPGPPDLTNIDIYAAVGARAPLVRTVSGVTVVDGRLDVRSVYGSADDPELAALEIIPTAPPPAPTVSSTVPATGATGVATSARPAATFSRDMDASSLSASTFTLEGSGGAAVTASVAYDAATRTATLTPAAALSASTTYTAHLTTGVRASDGTPLSAPVSWSFTTAAPPPPDTTAPTVSISAPADGATVSGSVALTAAASDDVGVDGVQFRVDGTDLGGEVTTAPWTRTWSTAGVANGLHTIVAVARDAAGNRTTSAQVSVRVDNPPVSAAGLVGAWGFEDGTGTAVDDASAANNDGTISGATWADGRFGRALSFDGVDDRVTIPDSDSLDLSDALTLETWVYPTSPGGWRSAILKEAGTKLAYALYASAWDNDVPSGHVTTAAESDTRGTGSLPTGTWTHLATTYDGSTLRLYVNGTQVSSRAVTGSAIASTGALRLGSNTIWGEAFSGRLDEVRIYGRALSTAEIRTDMDTPVRSSATSPTAGPEVLGQFSSPQTWPIVPVHMAMLSNGKITAWDGFDAALNSERVWDPAINGFTPVPSGRNLFCAGHVTLPDGRLFVAGGHVDAYKGLADTHIFDPQTNGWWRGRDMARARWYPTVTTLSDGRLLVVSGDNVTLNQTQFPVPLQNASQTLPEIYDVDRDTWTPLTAGQRRMPLYPFMFLLPDGKVVDAGPDRTTRVLDPATGQWTTVATSPIDGHSAVMYRPGKILKSGTWADPEHPDEAVTARAATIDMTAPTPAWTEVAPMNHPRAYHTLTVLPDGTVLSSGGGTGSDGVDERKGVLEAEIWDPATDTWREVAPYQRPRLYHSSALLLPDGRVLLAGGGAYGNATNESNAEIYSPPYMFKGARPVIAYAPQVARHGDTIRLDTPDAAHVTNVSLVHLGSVTHNFDMDQRFQWLSFRQAGSGLDVDLPTSVNEAPPGYYYLFLKDDKGAVSKGSIIKLSRPTGDTQAPTPPADLTATSQGTDVALTWSASTDDRAVTEYRVYRSTSPGVALTSANRIATTSQSSYTDRDLAPGTYSYVVVAVDAAGNVSPTSREETATITADTTPPTVSVTAPAAGATVGGAAVALAATAADDRGVTSVQFRVDGADVGPADTTAPYGATWDTRPLTDGDHQVTAVARDAAGHATTSDPVTVHVANGTPPTVAVTAPAAGATLADTVSVQADAADDRGVQSVQFKLDGANLGAADTTAPYAVDWDTKTATNAGHSLTAVATDSDGNATTSAPVAVTVANAAPPPPTGLVASYGFDEPSGTTALDGSGHALSGTISGATRTASGRFGAALSFDGVNDWVTVADADPLDLTTGMTLEAWVKPSAISSWRTVLMKEQTGGLVYGLYANGDTNRPSVNVNTGSEIDTRGTAQVSTTAWTHLAATYDGATLRLYVNGVQASSKALAGAIRVSSGVLRVGGNASWGEWFKGLVDEVRIYSRPLTAAEVQSDMTKAVTP